MKITRCASSLHFFDSDIYDTCPQCAGRQSGNAVAGTASPLTAEEMPARKIETPAPPAPPVQPAPPVPPVQPVQVRGNPDTVFCTGCGKSMAATKQFCSNCGKKLRIPEAPLQRIPQSAEDVPPDAARELPPEDMPVEDKPETSAGTPALAGWLVRVTGENRGRSAELISGVNRFDCGGDEDAGVEYSPVSGGFYIRRGTGGAPVYLNGEIAAEDCALKAYDRIRLEDDEFVFVPLCCDRFSWDEYIKE